MKTTTHPRTFRRARVAARVVVVAALTMAAAACGGDHTGGPTGAPEDVVTHALAVTMGAQTARIRIVAPTAEADGVVDLATRSGQLTVSESEAGPTRPSDLLISGGDGYIQPPTDRGYIDIGAAVPAALSGGDPFADLDLVGGTVHILSDGGEEAEGASTIRYTLTIAPDQAMSETPPARQAALRGVLEGRTANFNIDVWIDSKLFIRRVEVPADLRPLTPVTAGADRLPVVTDVNYLSFGVPVPPVEPPSTIPAG
jgi:hypothetical protein